MKVMHSSFSRTQRSTGDRGLLRRLGLKVVCLILAGRSLLYWNQLNRASSSALVYAKPDKSAAPKKTRNQRTKKSRAQGDFVNGDKNSTSKSHAQDGAGHDEAIKTNETTEQKAPDERKSGTRSRSQASLTDKDAKIGGQSGDHLQPRVRWNQKSESLYLSILTPACGEPGSDPLISKTRIKYSCTTKEGKRYLSEIKLLRPVAPQTAKIVKNANGVQVYVDKKRKEPCWRYLLKSRLNPAWLSKDFDQLSADDCQLHKELWRETYFRDKYKPSEAAVNAPPDAGPIDMEHQVKLATWNTAIARMRARAKPYDEIETFTL
ncbi:unnamed protein product [Amoebophrya sp. A25]|nr:unnamed protein product [Amoebophrya sp. A25]|eukprot:GSA25T00002287001.1